MNSTLQSYTIVPSDLYVERDADRQIQNVVNSMSRPGYVQVARQMGKTNLLLHTKEVMDCDKQVFAYIDLSSMSFSNESECYDEIIDIIVDSRLELYEDEFIIIENRRNSRGTTTQREFTRDLRLLLRKVDKLVIILDEIESLLGCFFSDNVFSLIRSIYFQRSSYKELSKLSFLLAGVTEPKNIIKNKDISPFNTSQLVLVKDFTREEYISFLKKTGLEEMFSDIVKERIYYWTQGQPRMTWDLCQIVSESSVELEADIDDIVASYYLATCDKAPIDSIRKLITTDIELRDAIVQLIYSKEVGISPDVKNKLLLSGITSYESSTIKFKNPIIEKSLPENWLLNINYGDSSIKESVDKASRLIFIEKDYTGAQLVLDTLSSSDNKNHNNDIEYLLGIVNFRQYKIDEAMTSFMKVEESGSYYVQSKLMLSKCYYSLGEYDRALNIIADSKKIISDSETEYKLLICQAQCLIEKGDNQSWSEAEKILGTIVSRRDNLHYLVLACYHSSRLYRKMSKKGLAVSLLDSALSYAQKDEIPVLLYEKFRSAEYDEQRNTFMRELVNSVAGYNKKPVVEDFDNELVFSQYYALLVFAEIILNYSQYLDSISPCFKWFYEKKEDLYSIICATLDQNNNPLAKQFAVHIIDKYTTGDSAFHAFQISEAYSVWAKHTDYSEELFVIGKKIYDFLSESNHSEFSVNPSLIRPLISQLEKTSKNRDYKYLKRVVVLASKWFNKLPNNKRDEEYFLLTSYYTAYVAFAENDYKMFMGAACMYLSREAAFIKSVTSDDDIDISVDTLIKYRNNLYTFGKHFNNIRKQLGAGFLINIIPNANSRVKVYDKVNNIEYKVKYKTVKMEVESGFIDILEVL